MMKVSAIIPSYNHEKYIAEAIDSILAQTHQDLELIIVDDGSQDSSVDLIKRYEDPRLKLICQENRGAHAAINRGLRVASGTYLTILNSDDVFDPSRFEKLLNSASKSPASLFTTDIEIIDDEGQQIAYKKGWRNALPSWAGRDSSDKYNHTNDYVLNLLLSNFVSTTSNIFMHRKVYDVVGGMRNLRFSHDWDFMLRVASQFHCQQVDEPLMKYRVHGSNTIKSNEKWMMFECAWVIATHMHRFTDRLFDQDGSNFANLEQAVRGLGNSIGPRGCDRLIWMLCLYFDYRRKTGANAPEEELLENRSLREQFMDFWED